LRDSFNPISVETFIANLPVQIFFKAAFKIDFWQTLFEIRSNFAIIKDTTSYEMTEIQTEHRIYNFDELPDVFTST
jgi:hypothetical protein